MTAGSEPGKRKVERPLGEVLAEYLRVSGIDRRMKHGVLYEAWEAAVGPGTATRARLVDFRRNVLRVEVSSSAMLQELSGFRKKEIVRRLNETLPGHYVADIRFQLGAF